MQMIPQSELRLGNWIQVEEKNYRVIYLSENGCGYDHEEFVSFENIVPISITDSILVKAGFTKDDYGYKNGSLALNQYDDVFHLRLPQGTGFGRGIKYVHQLQNLYYNISGEELSVRP